MLSPARLHPYVAAGHDAALAFRLYRWNMAASAAVYESLHLVEVVLRNAMDEQICIWNTHVDAREPGVIHRQDWTLDPCLSLARLVGDDLETAHKRAVKAVGRSHSSRRLVRHEDVIAQLTLGTWK